MKILVLNGSPRPGGNTKQMIEAFKAGAESALHQVNVVDVCKMKISGCLACLASPIYYHGISGQLKCTVDRFYAAAYPRKPKHLKKVAMILSSGDDHMYDGAMFSYEGDFLDYLGLENMGVVTAHGRENGTEKKLNELRKFGAGLK